MQRRNKIVSLLQNVTSEFSSQLIHLKKQMYSTKKRVIDKTSIVMLKNQLKLAMTKRTGRPLQSEEQEILKRISQKTAAANRNNVTRTKAYINFYADNYEIHWAFLAHMVSRNGGWNMTDIKGDLVGRILQDKSKQPFFLLLERCNWLIFQDAFPQLLLYEESKKRQQPLFYLLPYLNVSVFMGTMWEWYWKKRDSKLISYALIVNEQNYIETRVVQNEVYKTEVLETLPFIAQTALNMNLVFFPYPDEPGEMRLVGTILDDFTRLKERIDAGKKLYHILFESGAISEAIGKWARGHRHTGSRADFWPNVFSPTRDGIGITGSRIYSPYFIDAWKDIETPEPSGADEWCVSEHAIDSVIHDVDVEKIDLTDEYRRIIKALALLPTVK